MMCRNGRATIIAWRGDIPTYNEGGDRSFDEILLSWEERLCNPIQRLVSGQMLRPKAGRTSLTWCRSVMKIKSKGFTRVVDIELAVSVEQAKSVIAYWPSLFLVIVRLCTMRGGCKRVGILLVLLLHLICYDAPSFIHCLNKRFFALLQTVSKV